MLLIETGHFDPVDRDAEVVVWDNVKFPRLLSIAIIYAEAHAKATLDVDGARRLREALNVFITEQEG
jgi:hypothetical protein